MSQQQAIPDKLPEKLKFEFITPTRVLYDGPADEVDLAGSMGYMGVLPGHDPFMTTLTVGPLKLRIGDKVQQFYCGGGFLEINNELVRVLAEVAEKPDEIDAERAERARQRAEDRLLQSVRSDADVDFMRAAAALQRALTRLELAKGL